MNGAIYILVSKCERFVKVGCCTAGGPEGRARAYSALHGILFRVAWHAQTRDPYTVESLVHAELRQYQHHTDTGAREIFHVTAAEAQRVAEHFMRPALTPEQIAAAIELEERRRHNTELLNEARKVIEQRAAGREARRQQKFADMRAKRAREAALLEQRRVARLAELERREA